MMNSIFAVACSTTNESQIMVHTPLNNPRHWSQDTIHYFKNPQIEQKSYSNVEYR